MRRTRTVLMIGLLLTGLAGCQGAIVGDWQLVRSIPNREVFAIDNARFEKGGGFTATITRDGKTNRQSGRYEFNGYRITLRPSAGGQYRFNAIRKPSTLEISDGKRRVILRSARPAREENAAEYEEGEDADT